MARLVDESRGVVFEIGGPEVGLGRLPENQVVLEHPAVSRRHARIVRRPEGWLLEDLGSTAGTTVNGSPVRAHWLLSGDVVALGPVTLRFEPDLQPAAPPPPPPYVSAPSITPPPSPSNAVAPGSGSRQWSTAAVLAVGCSAAAVLALGVAGIGVALWWQSGGRTFGSPHGEEATTERPTVIPIELDMPERPFLEVTLGDEVGRRRVEAGEGGEVAAPGLRLVLPPGALDRDREVVVRSATVPPPPFEVAAIGGPPQPVEVLAAWDVDLGGGSGALGRPAELEVDLDALGLGGGGVVMPVTTLDGRSWDRLPFRREGSRISFATNHFTPLALVGWGAKLMGIGIAAYAPMHMVLYSDTELPSFYEAYAPYVSLVHPLNQERFEIMWSTKLKGVDPETGLKKHDPDALIRAMEEVVLEHQRRVGAPSTDPQDWPPQAVADVQAALAELMVDTLTPDVVREVQESLEFARGYLEDRDFEMPALDLPVYVAPSVSVGPGILHNPWSGRRYVVLAENQKREVLWTTALHELFHHAQTGYVWVDRSAHLPLMEASALMLEREAAPRYRAEGKPFDPAEGLALAQFLVFHHGLDGPRQWDERPVRSFGYGLTWFLEHLRDRASADGVGREAFHARLLEAWGRPGLSSLRPALLWAAGDDEERLRTSWRTFAREVVLRDLEHDAAARGPVGRLYGCAPFTDTPYREHTTDEVETTVREAHGLERCAFDFSRAPLQTLGEPGVRPWSIGFYRCDPPNRADATLVVRVPRALAPKTGGLLEVFVRAAPADADPQPVQDLDRAPATSDSVWATLPFDRERFVYLVDSGRVGGWVTTAPAVQLMVLEPPTGVTLQEEGGVITVSWTRPPLAAEAGVPLGFRVRVTDGPAWTMVVPADRSSVTIDYRQDQGRVVSEVSVTTVLQIALGPDGEPTFLESAPATASTLVLAGPQVLNLRLEQVDESVSCDDGEPPVVQVYVECRDMDTIIGADGGFTFTQDDVFGPGRQCQGRGMVQGDRLRLSAVVTKRDSHGSEPENYSRSEVECSFDVEVGLWAPGGFEHGVGLREGTTVTCTQSLDRRELALVGTQGGAPVFDWVERHQRCVGQAQLSGSFQPH